MIPRVDQRIWIIVFWYLLLKCPFEIIIPLPGALGSTVADEETRELQTDGSLESLYHRMLDNNEFNGMFPNAPLGGPNVPSIESDVDSEPKSLSQQRGNDWPTLSSVINHRHRIDVAYRKLDNIFNPVERDGERQAHGGEIADREVTSFDRNHMSNVPDRLPARTRRVDQVGEWYDVTGERHRRSVEGKASSGSTPEALATSSVPLVEQDRFTSSVANGAYVSLNEVGFYNIGASETDVHGSPSRRSNNARTSDGSVVHFDGGALAVSSNVKESNLGQVISNSKMDLGHGEASPASASTFGTLGTDASEKPGEQSSSSPEPSREKVPSRFPPAGSPEEGAIMASHSSVTSDSDQLEGAPNHPVDVTIEGDGRAASFVLLDDSVYVSPGHSLRRNGSQAGPDLPSAGTDLTLDSAIFGGRNFDEQIIFLNGPDLLETSVEQESSSPPFVARPMRKVARAVWADDAEYDTEDGTRDDPLALPLRPIVRDPAEAGLLLDAGDNMVVVYADQRETVRLNCEVDADITTSVWLKDGQIVHATDKKSRTADIRFVREPFGGLTIQSVMHEDDGVWQCEAENARGFFFNGRPIKLIVLDAPKKPYLLIDSRRLDAGNMFIPVKENSELTLSCVSEGGNPNPTLTWEVLLSPGIDRHAQKLPNDVLELQETKKDKDKEPYRINSGAVSEAKLAAVYRVHHNARILCIMEHPTLKVRQNASILLDVQYTPSFAITRTPGFGYPLREGIEVSLKCDVDSNPPSTPLWQKDDGDTPVPQIGDGFLNFSSIRREHSGWYKCTSRHLNFQYSSIGYYLSVRYEPVDVTSEPDEQDISMSPSSSSASSAASAPSEKASPASSSPTSGGASSKSSASLAVSPIGSSLFKPGGQMEVELGGSVTLQCPQGSLGCWSHLDSASTVRLRGPGGQGQVSLKDVVYQDAGTYKCVGGQNGAGNRKKLDLPRTVKAPTVSARNSTPSVLPGTPLHLSVEFCANPPAYAARWLHGDRVYTPGNQYGSDVMAYGFTDLPTPFCKEARLTYVHMHESVPRRFYFIVSSPGGVAEAVFKVNYTPRHRTTGTGPASPSSSTGKYGNSFSSSSSSGSSSVSSSAPSPASSSSGAANVNGGLSGYRPSTNTINSALGNGLDDNGEQLMDPEEIHFPIFGSGGGVTARLGLPVAVATLASLLQWHRLLYALPLLVPLLPLPTL